MTLETTTYQCPSCTAPLRFDGDAQMLICDYCGSQFSPEEVERRYAEKQKKADDAARAADVASAAHPSAAEASVLQDENLAGEAPAPAADPIAEYLKRSTWNDKDSERMRAYGCPSCGAQIMADQTTAVTRCPYCGNNAVLPGQLADELKPDFVVPFKLDKDDAVRALGDYYHDKRFLPAAFTNQNHVEEIQGVYVPFWLYSVDVQSEGTFTAENVQAWSDGSTDYVKTDQYKLYRLGTMRFDNVPVDGSTRMPDAHMDAIEPFDYQEMVPFSLGYLPGYLADRYDQNARTCQERAEARIRQSATTVLQKSASGYNSIQLENCDTKPRWDQISYALMPVWMLHTRWNGQDFLFAMNGQTGRLVGDLPVDRGKVVRRFLTLFLPIAAALAIIAFGVL